jgi:6-pyruvoyl-tetrahydropterin synthase related domain
LQAVAVAFAALLLGFLVVDALSPAARIDLWTRLGLSFTGVVGLSLVLMLAHVATGGRLLSRPVAVRLVVSALALVLLAVKVTRAHREGASKASLRELAGMLLLVALGISVWCSPVLRMMPIGHIGDQNLHMGWANQIANGQSVPTAALSGDIPNYYPWLFHGLATTLSHFVRGGTAHHAQAPLFVLQVAGAVLTSYALGRRLTGRSWTGAATAIFVALSGGLGYFLLSRPDFVYDPRAEGGRAALRYGGDLLYRRSYNLSFHNFAPVFPRDVAYVLTFAFLLLLVVGLERGSVRACAAAGVVLGFVALTGAETFIVGVGVALGVSSLSTTIGRGRTAAALLLPAFALWSLWIVPLAINYARLGGFRNTASPLVTSSPSALLITWGVAAPFAALGALVSRPGRRPGPTYVVLVQLAVALAAVVACRVLPLLLGPGFTTLGRQHRYWPLVHLGVALYGALGLSWLLERVRIRLLRALAVAAVLALAIPSPLLGSWAYPSKLEPPEDLTAAMQAAPLNALSFLDSPPGQRCVIAVPTNIALDVFGYTGHRFVSFPYGLESPTSARVRWRSIYEHVLPPEVRLAALDELIEGPRSARRLHALSRTYGQDKLLARETAEDRWTRLGYRPAPVRLKRETFSAVTLGPCEGAPGRADALPR